MINIGKFNQLEIVKFTEQGAYLDGGPYGEILLPNRYVPENCKEGDMVNSFISFDSEDRILASTDQPLAQADEFAYLEVVDVTTVGAFLDWGLPKNLLVPYREQGVQMERGRKYMVKVYVDDQTQRMVASAKINQFLNKEPIDFSDNDEVDLFIVSRTDLGYKAIINDKHMGLIYFNEVFKRIKAGDKMKGYIKLIRPDGKIDLSLEPIGYAKVDPVSQSILDQLKENDGFLNVTDKSSPEIIKEIFGVSKKTFKKAVGALYKAKRIVLETDGIRLI